MSGCGAPLAAEALDPLDARAHGDQRLVEHVRPRIESEGAKKAFEIAYDVGDPEAASRARPMERREVAGRKSHEGREARDGAARRAREVGEADAALGALARHAMDELPCGVEKD